MHFGDATVDFTFENRSFQILASCNEICGSVCHSSSDELTYKLAEYITTRSLGIANAA